ncbi:exodeoxyribonuclease V subunit alpha [soil metagenome]
MIDLDPYDVRLAVRATGLLRDFNQAGVLSAADVHVARRLGRLSGENDERVLLAAALAVRGVRLGSVCVHLPRVRETVTVDDETHTHDVALAWPDPAAWLTACAGSVLVAVGVDDEPGAAGVACPLRLMGDLLYLDRYWRQEHVVRSEMDARALDTRQSPDPAALRAVLAEHFPARPPDQQRLAAAMGALRSVSVVAGGPGTGKTTMVARLLAVLRSLAGESPRIALAAPTGKAAARLQEAVRAESSARDLGLDDITAATIHRLLGWQPGSRSRFRHDRDNRLPYDVVVVDETSMVSLTLMSRLLEAVRPDARLVLVGDPDHLASVEAGAVLGDLVARPAPAGAQPPATLHEVAGADLSTEVDPALLSGGVVRLTTVYRFGSEIGALAEAVRGERPAEALTILRGGSESVSFVEVPDVTVEPAGRHHPRLAAVRADVTAAAVSLTAAARSGDAAAALSLLERHRLLCAHRRGPYGVSWWSRQVERWVMSAVDGADEGEWYAGRPLLVDTNDYELGLFNGDTGVVVAGQGQGQGPVAAFLRGSEPLLVAPARLGAVQTVHAMTVHRAQGSQFDTVTLMLPPADSPLLTRELLYTALTRARTHVRVVGTEEAVVRAIGRPIMRASGLRTPG